MSCGLGGARDFSEFCHEKMSSPVIELDLRSRIREQFIRSRG